MTRRDFSLGSKALAAVLAAMLPLSGCSLNRKLFDDAGPRNQAEAGSTHVAVLSVAPWDDFAKELQPKFTFDEVKALELSAATTQAFEEKVVDALKMMVELAPPQSTTTQTIRKTEGLKDEAGRDLPPRTSDRTDTRSPGDLSESLTTDLGEEADLPNVTGSTSPLTRQLAVEPMLKYAAATALFQEVRLLNRYIEQAVQRHDYQAYAVRLQVTLMPSARNEPVDAYTTTSFFLGDGNGSSSLAAPISLVGGAANWSWNLYTALSGRQIRTLTRVVDLILNESETSTNECGNLLEKLEDSSRSQGAEIDVRSGNLDRIELQDNKKESGSGESNEKKEPSYFDIARTMGGEGAEFLDAVERFSQSKGLKDKGEAQEREFKNNCREVAWRLRLASSPKRVPFVVPILVTDDLELSAQARALNEARQFAFGLQVMAQGFGGNVGSTRLARKLQAITGSDINSLMTVSRLTDNSVRVRFGAMQQTTAKYSMVPRTNSVTLLMLVPKESTVTSDNLGSYINVMARTEMIHAKTGQRIPPAPIADPERACTEIARPYRSLLSVQALCKGSQVQEILNGVLRNDFRGFKLDVARHLLSGQNDFPYEQLWLDFAVATTYSPYASTNFELPKLRVPEFFCQQASVLVDDGKAEASVMMRDGRFLSPGILSAAVKVKEKDKANNCDGATKEHIISATQVIVTDDKTSAILKFPSLASLGLDPACVRGLELTCRGCVKPLGCSSPCDSPNNAPAVVYTLTGLQRQEVKPEAKVARFTLAPASASVARHASGVTTIRLIFKKRDKKEAAQFGFGFAVEGARVTGVAATSGTTALTATAVGNPQTYQVITDQMEVTVDVTLADLGDGITVKSAERVQKVGTLDFEDGVAFTPLAIPVLSSVRVP